MRSLTITYIFVLVSSALVLVTLALLLPQRAQAAYSTTTLLEATNAERTKNNLPALTWNEKLGAAAQKAADDLARNEAWTHKGAWTYLTTAGYRWTYAGQNLARKFTDTNATTQAWMNSPTHRSNILFGPFQETGIALSKAANGDMYVVQYFAEPIHLSKFAKAVQ